MRARRVGARQDGHARIERPRVTDGQVDALHLGHCHDHEGGPRRPRSLQEPPLRGVSEQARDPPLAQATRALAGREDELEVTFGAEGPRLASGMILLLRPPFAATLPVA